MNARGLSVILGLAALAMVAALVTMAATPAAPQQPGKPAGIPTGVTGELRISWSAAVGANFYDVGWVDVYEMNQMIKAGRDPLDAVYFVTISATYTSHTIKRLNDCGEYYVLVRSRTGRFDGSASLWSISDLITMPGRTAAGSCSPTTPTVPVEYLSVGESVKYPLGQLFTLKRVAKISGEPVPLPDGTIHYNEPFPRRQYIEMCAELKATEDNQIGGFAVARNGEDYNIVTDAGMGFSSGEGQGRFTTGGVPPGVTHYGCDIWDIPSTATTVIVGLNTHYSGIVYYKVDLQ